MLVSKFSALFDPLGKLVPLTASMKVHLRKVVKNTLGWDDQVLPDVRQTWVQNLWKLYNMQGMKFSRAIIPSDAVNTKLELFVCVDAAEVKVAGIWGRFLRRNGTHSCQHIIGRALLAASESTIPKQELESLVKAELSFYISVWYLYSSLFCELTVHQIRMRGHLIGHLNSDQYLLAY